MSIPKINLGGGITAEYDASAELGDEIELIADLDRGLIILPLAAFDKLAAFVTKHRSKS